MTEDETAPSAAAETHNAETNARPTASKPEVAKADPSFLDSNGRPLFLIENVKGSKSSGANSWMWENASLIMPSKDETRSSACLGAFCLRCEELGRAPKDCILSYHPQRNFKAISRHFKRHHTDLQSEKEASTKKPVALPALRKRADGDISHGKVGSPSTRSNKRIKASSENPTREVVPRSRVLLVGKGTRRHQIVAPPSFHACGDRQVVVTEHMISVPLHRSSPDPGSIDIYFTVVEKIHLSNRQFFRGLQEISPTQRAIDYVEEANLMDASSLMLYLQGGPGMGCPIPCLGIGFEKHSSWAARALDHYSRVVLMDQRGTGR